MGEKAPGLKESCPGDCRGSKTIVVIMANAGVETLADKCSRCGKLSNLRTEV